MVEALLRIAQALRAPGNGWIAIIHCTGRGEAFHPDLPDRQFCPIKPDK